MVGVTPEVEHTQLFINNHFVDAQSRKTFEVVNPTTEDVICSVASAEETDVNAAVAAAKKAFEIGSEWRTMDASVRGELL